MPEHHVNWELAHGRYQRDIYFDGLKGTKPLFTTNSCYWESAAKKALPANAYVHVAGRAGRKMTMDSNRAAFRKWSIIPRRLRDNTTRDIKTTLFGQVYRSPVLMVPVGVYKIASETQSKILCV